MMITKDTTHTFIIGLKRSMNQDQALPSTTLEYVQVGNMSIKSREALFSSSLNVLPCACK
jgi:hypothetical protein